MSRIHGFLYNSCIGLFLVLCLSVFGERILDMEIKKKEYNKKIEEMFDKVDIDLDDFLKNIKRQEREKNPPKLDMNDYIGDEEFITLPDGNIEKNSSPNPPFFFKYDEMQ